MRDKASFLVSGALNAGVLRDVGSDKK